MKIVNEYWLQDNNGKLIELSEREVKIVNILLIDDFISYKKICEILYSSYFNEDYMRAIISFMSRLNKKIKNSMNIKNRRKIGYYVKK